MLIHQLTKWESLNLLARTHFGRLACSQGMQPYIVPFNFAYQDGYLYSFCMLGQKIEWMRANPLVCVQADDIVSAGQWTSVVVFGRYEELPDTLEMKSERLQAWQLLQQRTLWWEPGSVKIAAGGTTPAAVPIYYRIHLVQITGRRATSELGARDTKQSTAGPAKEG